ncbi:MAG: amidase, partial [Candidatus Methylomirabilis sp.]|nr:amidase [Deltaproteobacteria bacterium]
MDELLTQSALDLARLIRDGEVSPVEVVEAHVRRCEAVDPVIHGIVNARYDRALAEAKECERRLGARRTGGLPPLFGVPYTIKESHGAEGLPQTGGLVRRRGKLAPADSEMAARMKAAGAILLGNTNLPEAMMWYESYSRVYP